MDEVADLNCKGQEVSHQAPWDSFLGAFARQERRGEASVALKHLKTGQGSTRAGRVAAVTAPGEFLRGRALGVREVYKLPGSSNDTGWVKMLYLSSCACVLSRLLCKVTRLDDLKKDLQAWPLCLSP